MSDKKHLPRPTNSDFQRAAIAAREARHERGPANADLTVAMQVLHTRMANAGAAYCEGDIADQRLAVLEAITAVYDMLIDQGFSPFTLAPLFRPVDALEAQFHAKPDLLFSESRKKGGVGGRTKNSPDRHYRDGVLAALANFWIEHHKGDESIKQTLGRAARHFHGRWFGDKIDQARLTAARNLVSQEGFEHPAVQSAAATRKFLSEIAVAFGSTDALAIAVRWLNDAPRALGAGNWEHLDPDKANHPS